MDYEDVELSELNGKVIKSVIGLDEGSEHVDLTTECDKVYRFFHEQDCCETVTLNDYEGTNDELIGGLVISTEEVSGEDEELEYADSYTWTFYKIETTKGGLWMRWLGESNGYYSESVDFVRLTNNN